MSCETISNAVYHYLIMGHLTISQSVVKGLLLFSLREVQE